MFLDDYGRWNVYFVKDNREILWCRSVDRDAVRDGTNSWEMFGDNGTDPARMKNRVAKFCVAFWAIKML